VVKVSHSLPAGLPLPADAKALRVGRISVVGPATAAYTFGEVPAGGAVVPVTPELARLMATRLGQALETKGHIHPRLGDTRPAANSGECIIDATIHVAIHEMRGKRDVLLLDPATKATRPREVPTLVRRAEVRVEFAVTRAGAGQGLGIVEVARTYDSALDPAVRGELGLERPDDPNRVPPVEAIVKDLLDQCAPVFQCMISPTPIGALVQLRPAWGPEADKAFAAIREHSYGLVVEEFRKALAVDPNSPARIFNFAVAAEAGDEFDQAEKHYQRAFDLSGEKDAEAYDGARRCRRVLEALKTPELPARRIKP